jgi:hypothetical protein
MTLGTIEPSGKVASSSDGRMRLLRRQPQRSLVARRGIDIDLPVAGEYRRIGRQEARDDPAVDAPGDWTFEQIPPVLQGTAAGAGIGRVSAGVAVERRVGRQAQRAEIIVLGLP